MTILTGCAKPAVKIVQVSDFCTGRYESLWLNKIDFSNIDEMRKNPAHRVTLDKYLDYQTINEKEFDQCQSSVTLPKAN